MEYTKHFECGCKVMVIGELTNAQILYCPKHYAAPELYEALKMMVAADFGLIEKHKIDRALKAIALVEEEKC